MKNAFRATIVIGAILAAASMANAKSKSKTSYNTAKKQCLDEDPSLKGRALQKCISQKRKS